MNKENKDKTIINKIIGLVLPESKQILSQSEIAQQAGLVTMSAVVGNWVGLADGWYTQELDGTRFRIENGTIVELATASAADAPADDAAATDTNTDDASVTDNQSAQTKNPESDKYADQFNAINEKLTAVMEFDNKLKALEDKINAIGKQPAAAPVGRTQSMEADKPKNDLRKYFTDEKSYKEFVQRHS